MKINNPHWNALMLSLVLAGATALSTGCAGTNNHRSAGTYLDDKSISTRVKTDLFRDPVVSGLDVHVKTYRGNVQLSGFVDTPEQQQRAASIASSVQGVQQVTNELQIKPIATAVGTPGPTVQGTTVTQSSPPLAADDLNRNLAPAPGTPTPPAVNPGAPVYSPTPTTEPGFNNNVEISTVNGRVILRGTVATESQRRDIEKKVRDIPGIVGVDNELRVRSPM